MLNGIETIFDNTTQMLRHLKKKSFEKNTQDFIDSYGHYFREMTEYVDSISDKKRAAEEIADTLINRVEKKFASKKGKIDSRTQVDLNFFMIYYVFPTILGTEHEYAKLIADSICSAWGKRFKESQIQYTDYDTLYGSFREKIFGIFKRVSPEQHGEHRVILRVSIQVCKIRVFSDDYGDSPQVSERGLFCGELFVI